MAVDATARLYDVDEDTVVFTKLDKTQKYDQGEVRFRARKGKLINLEKLHESIWATRLSGRTSSGLVSLEVVAVGNVIKTQDGATLKVADSDSEFHLIRSSEHPEVFDQLLQAGDDQETTVSITGVVDGYQGRWPSLFKSSLPAVRTLRVTSFDTSD